MARTTVRTLSKVKSSPMMARQPSVPNVILLTEEKYKRRAWWREAVMWERRLCGERQIGGSIRCSWRVKRGLKQGFLFFLFEPFDDLGDVLGATARAEEDGVVGFDQNQIADAEGGDEFLRGPEKIPGGIKSEGWAGGEISARLGEQFVDGVPGADVTPADFRGDYRNASPRKTSRRSSFVARRRCGLTAFGGGFVDCVIHRNVFELRVDFLQRRSVPARTDGFREFDE